MLDTLKIKHTKVHGATKIEVESAYFPNEPIKENPLINLFKSFNTYYDENAKKE